MRCGPARILEISVAVATFSAGFRSGWSITTEKDIAFWYDLLNEKGQKPFEAWSQFLQSIGSSVMDEMWTGKDTGDFSRRCDFFSRVSVGVESV
jgi:hypothetical protein